MSDNYNTPAEEFAWMARAMHKVEMHFDGSGGAFKRKDGEIIRACYDPAEKLWWGMLDISERLGGPRECRVTHSRLAEVLVALEQMRPPEPARLGEEVARYDETGDLEWRGTVINPPPGGDAALIWVRRHDYPPHSSGILPEMFYDPDIIDREEASNA